MIYTLSLCFIRKIKGITFWFLSHGWNWQSVLFRSSWRIELWYHFMFRTIIYHLLRASCKFPPLFFFCYCLMCVAGYIFISLRLYSDTMGTVNQRDTHTHTHVQLKLRSNDFARNRSLGSLRNGIANDIFTDQKWKNQLSEDAYFAVQ